MKKKNEFSLTSDLYLLRAEKRWTQKYVADQLGVTRQTVHSLEANKYNPSLALAFEIAFLFDKRIDEIFTYKKGGIE
ncbi:helix-turn-helix transcriptional regulator [Geomicrobium sp. JCM 19039]|uniref:helix-turn-helix transcriptional regulator n=1 Tax=Geomicrobium sp. JCM 19039 TaxID=1460636 RepID=UPI00045F3C73|nr:helix-turn-helix transcriptional regulator [Geomicrobium sp. JCM 19039]GAK12441.1 transcriptional regulator, Cro/CI family [Geomicrobium sp. JCM 19039]